MSYVKLHSRDKDYSRDVCSINVMMLTAKALVLFEEIF